jgi:hypothetical protein
MRIAINHPSFSQEGIDPKRKPDLAAEQYQEMADSHDIGEIYPYLYDEFQRISNGLQLTQSSVGFKGRYVMDGIRMGVFVHVIPTQSSRDKGLKFQVYLSRAANFLKIPEMTIKNVYQRIALGGIILMSWNANGPGMRVFLDPG